MQLLADAEGRLLALKVLGDYPSPHLTLTLTIVAVKVLGDGLTLTPTLTLTLTLTLARGRTVLYANRGVHEGNTSPPG